MVSCRAGRKDGCLVTVFNFECVLPEKWEELGAFRNILFSHSTKGFVSFPCSSLPTRVFSDVGDDIRINMTLLQEQQKKLQSAGLK